MSDHEVTVRTRDRTYREEPYHGVGASVLLSCSCGWKRTYHDDVRLDQLGADALQHKLEDSCPRCGVLMIVDPDGGPGYPTLHHPPNYRCPYGQPVELTAEQMDAIDWTEHYP
jgi:hypothetical protein